VGRPGGKKAQPAALIERGPPHGGSPRAPFAKWRTQTFVAGLRADRLTAPWVIEGAVNRHGSNAYVETQLAPALRKGDVVILDNLSVHKSAKARAALRERGAWLLFLPQYSPDLRGGFHNSRASPSATKDMQAVRLRPRYGGGGAGPPVRPTQPQVFMEPAS
jgi:DDE superfamily endonuclease